MVPMVRGSQGKSGNFKKSGKVRENPDGRGKQGIQKYHGAKVNKDAEKTELLLAHCIQQFKIFSALFARRLFILLLFHFFCRPCF